ncbi:MAG: hypothetical protein IJ719_09655 [Clostridia bacterium]|nr:hypothetical protein [Clostridia bacterium]
MPNRRDSRTASTKAALCGLMVALSAVLMIAGTLIPVGAYAVPLFSAVLLIPILFEYGQKAAFLAYLAVSLLSLFLGMDKEASFFYIFIGYYPIIKFRIDRIHNRWVRFLIKLLIFNGSYILMYSFLGFILHMDAVIAEFGEMGNAMLVFFAILLNISLFLYDRLLYPLSILYLSRIRPRLKLPDDHH